MFLDQCNNQKNYSFVCYNIEEKEMEVQLIFALRIFKKMYVEAEVT